MYIPEINLLTDRKEIFAFMQRFSFATLVTSKDNTPIATHLPFLVSSIDDTITLTSHFAKTNTQWQHIENEKVLVIFNEPHAYISPKHYDNELSVPTWNYIAIHAYGQASLIKDTPGVFEVLEKTIDNYEAPYRQSWDSFPAEYKFKMSNRIVAFNVHVNDLQAKRKLSQNRTMDERKKIIETLSKSGNTNEQLISEYMKNMER